MSPVDGGGGLRQQWAFAGQDTFERLADVRQEVEPIRHLDRVGRALARAIGVGAAPIAGYHRDTRMGAQPRRDGVGRPIPQQVDHLMPFEVDEDRPVGLAAFVGPVIDAQDPRSGFVGSGVGADQARDRRTAPFEPAPLREPRARRAARFQAEVLQGHPLRIGPSRPGADDVWEPLAKDASGAATVDATKPTGLEAQADRPTAPRKIGQRAVVMAVDPRRLSMTQRAYPSPTPWRGHDGQSLFLDDELAEVQASEVWYERSKAHARELLNRPGSR